MFVEPPTYWNMLRTFHWSCSTKNNKNARLFIILFVRDFGGFVHNFGRVFAILFEVLLIEIQKKSVTLLVGRGGVRSSKAVNKYFVNKLAFPKEQQTVTQHIRGVHKKGKNIYIYIYIILHQIFPGILQVKLSNGMVAIRPMSSRRILSRVSVLSAQRPAKWMSFRNLGPEGQEMYQTQKPQQESTSAQGPAQ